MKAALVIGNSDGIGLALTELLLAEGWKVTGLSRSNSRVVSASYEHHVVDVCNEDYPTTLAAAAQRWDTPDVCVYCVGTGEFLELDNLANERRVFETNLIGAVATLQVVLPLMVRSGRGHFIGVSSQADVLTDAQAPSYAASKAGLSSYLEGLALACRSHGVRVTNVRFGFVDTKMAKSSVRPFMVSANEAAQRIRRCIDVRPLRYTFPKRMAVLLWLVQLRAKLRLWAG